jgi:hypothetical protein
MMIPKVYFLSLEIDNVLTKAAQFLIREATDLQDAAYCHLQSPEQMKQQIRSGDISIRITVALHAACIQREVCLDNEKVFSCCCFEVRKNEICLKLGYFSTTLSLLFRSKYLKSTDKYFSAVRLVLSQEVVLSHFTSK